MKAPLGAGLVASSFGLGGWFADRRVAALVAVVKLFCAEAAVCYRAREDGRAADGTRDLLPAGGVTVRGGRPGPHPAYLWREPGRIVVDAPRVALANLGGYGYVHVRASIRRVYLRGCLRHALARREEELPLLRPEGRLHGPS